MLNFGLLNILFFCYAVWYHRFFISFSHFLFRHSWTLHKERCCLITTFSDLFLGAIILKQWKDSKKMLTSNYFIFITGRTGFYFIIFVTVNLLFVKLHQCFNFSKMCSLELIKIKHFVNTFYTKKIKTF